jgi:signal transduction histidine kinase
MDAAGKVVAINVVVEEVTERKRIERELRDKIEELEAVLEAVPAAVFLANDRECKAMIGNRMTEQILRLRRGANLSMSADIDPPKNYKVLKDGVELPVTELPVQQAAATGKTVAGFELTLAFENGDERHVFGNAAPLFDSSGRTRGAVGACVDVTEMVEARKMAERNNVELERRVEARTRELVATNARLAHQIAEREKVEHALWQVQKQDAIGLLASGVAHDFNNILNVIAGSLKMIEVQQSKKPIERYLKMAQGAVERGTSLTQRLLTFVRTNQFSPTVIDANELVLSVGELLKRTIGVEIEIKRVLAPDLWPVLIDKNQFEMVLLNLAINARDAMPHGGLLTFESMNLAANDASLPKEMARDSVCVRIADTGHGMSEDVLARVREPFFTTKAPGKGTGLGLSMVDGFVRQSGGSLRITSRVAVGTVVEIFLPKADVTPKKT